MHPPEAEAGATEQFEQAHMRLRAALEEALPDERLLRQMYELARMAPTQVTPGTRVLEGVFKNN